jgi:hypothetical protein
VEARPSVSCTRRLTWSKLPSTGIDPHIRRFSVLEIERNHHESKFENVCNNTAVRRIRNIGYSARARPRTLSDLCTPQAQQEFDRGLAMVHSFVYPDRVAAFTEVAAADLECVTPSWLMLSDDRAKQKKRRANQNREDSNDNEA